VTDTVTVAVELADTKVLSVAALSQLPNGKNDTEKETAFALLVERVMLLCSTFEDPDVDPNVTLAGDATMRPVWPPLPLLLLA